MRIARLTGTAVAVAGLAASLLVAPLASPSAAALTTDERLWTIADSDDDGTYGLHYVNLATQNRVTVDETPDADLGGLAASRDGSRIVYLRYTETKQQVVVRDMSTRVVRTVATLGFGAVPEFVVDAQLSPDGNTVAWTKIGFSGDGILLQTTIVPVGGGTAVALPRGYGALAFLTDETLLVQTLGGYNQTVPVSGGSFTPVNGLPLGAQQVALSADGSRIAWSLDTSDPEAEVSTATVSAGALAAVGNAWTVSSVRHLSTAFDNTEPAFSRDGADVHWVTYDGDAGLGSIVFRPYDASEPVGFRFEAPPDYYDVAITMSPSVDTTPPGLAVALPAELLGTSAVVHWVVPEGADVSGVVVYRKVADVITKTAFVAAPAGTYKDTGLTVGEDYTYELHVVDRSNNYGDAATRDITALQALPALFYDPTSTGSTRAPFPVLIGGEGPESATWTVDYLPSGTWTWKPWVTGVHTAGVRTFGSSSTTGVIATTSTLGKSYTFRTRITDAHGNRTPYVNSARAVVPFDQTKASFSGGSNVYTSSAYMGFVRKLWKRTDSATVRLQGSRLQVVGARCPTCGKVDVYEDGVLIATVDTYASSTKPRQVLFSRSYVEWGDRVYTLRPRPANGRPDVLLDGFATRA